MEITDKKKIRKRNKKRVSMWCSDCNGFVGNTEDDMRNHICEISHEPYFEKPIMHKLDLCEECFNATICKYYSRGFVNDKTIQQVTFKCKFYKMAR